MAETEQAESCSLAKLRKELDLSEGIPFSLAFTKGDVTGVRRLAQAAGSRLADAAFIQAPPTRSRSSLAWHAALQLGETPRFPPQYQRAFDLGFPEMFVEGG